MGFIKKSIWLAGIKSQGASIWNGDGLKWNPVCYFRSTGHEWDVFYNICGDSPDNVYAVGAYDTLINGLIWDYGLIFHYDGIQWQRIDINKIKSGFHVIYKKKEGNGKYYLWGFSYSPIDGHQFFKMYEFFEKAVKEIYSIQITNNTFASMRMINGKIYFSLNSDVCRYINGEFQVIKKIEGINKGRAIIGGRSENDLFIALPECLAHYDGSDLKTIYNLFGKERVMDMAVFKDTVFALIPDFNSKSYILKGILKKEGADKLK